MPAFLLVRLYRMLPLIVVLGIVAVTVYLLVSWRHTPTHAKHALIKVFTILGIGLTGFFGVATLYALLDGNAFVAEFFLVCALFMAVLLGKGAFARYLDAEDVYVIPIECLGA